MAQIRQAPVDSGSRRYISAAMDAPFLERDHELELARRWRDQGDAQALHELVFAYARFVIKIASRFRGYGLPLADLVQEGNVGLMEAAARFDPERDVRFSTYASWWVIAAIQEYVLRNASIVRIGTTAAQKSLFFNLRRLRAQLADSPDGLMSDDDRRRIARELSVPLAAVERMESHLSRPDQSLNATVGAEEGDAMFQDFLADDAPTPEEITARRHDTEVRAEWIDDALAELSPREREIISRRFLVDEPSTLAELGSRMGVSKERIRQIEAKALGKLKSRLDERVPDREEFFG